MQRRSGPTPRSRPVRRGVLTAGAGPVAVGVVALAVIVLIVIGLAPFGDEFSRATRALLLVLPVIGAAVVGGRRPGYVAAAGATAAFALTVPPVGSVRIAVAEDVVALVVFLLVAVVSSTLVTARIDALAEVDRQRSLLLRSVSHDLRTPLATIRAATTELLDGAVHDEAAQRRMLELVETEAQHLDRLVANLLELGRIESGAMEPRTSSVEPVALARSAVAAVASAHAGIVFRVSPADPLEEVDVDPTQFRQALTNLIDNAARHSPDGATVTVTVTVDRDTRSVRFDVDDEGPGVDPSEAELIFRPFRSGTLAGSSGVGLAICRAVVESHGGTIEVDDGPLGGARFRVELPLRQPGRRHRR